MAKGKKIEVQGKDPDFNYGEFAIIKSQPGLNYYKLSDKEFFRLVSKANASFRNHGW